jgi:hypothetical protein|tara:strand:- start:200 stop:583 length:384 start_codon:yes stop_codon:yes gene_type:complete
MIKRNKNEFKERVDLLLENIGKNYDSWNGIEPPREMDELTLKIKTESSERFKETLKLSHGRKYIKVLHDSSVWGFIAVTDGILKGIPYKFGDVFKAASWRGPAKHVRGSIFLDRTDWFHWTGPEYLI